MLFVNLNTMATATRGAPSAASSTTTCVHHLQQGAFVEGLLEDPITLAVAAAFGLALVLAIYATLQHYKLPTLSKYKELHPRAKDKSGVPTCFSCNTTSIYLQNGQKSFGNVHICRICGTKLWRS
jgi:hypothetical protein